MVIQSLGLGPMALDRHNRVVANGIVVFPMRAHCRSVGVGLSGWLGHVGHPI